eukprot:9603209-Alexandrium_andersonii.AAC.1
MSIQKNWIKRQHRAQEFQMGTLLQNLDMLYDLQEVKRSFADLPPDRHGAWAMLARYRCETCDEGVVPRR